MNCRVCVCVCVSHQVSDFYRAIVIKHWASQFQLTVIILSECCCSDELAWFSFVSLLHHILLQIKCQRISSCCGNTFEGAMQCKFTRFYLLTFLAGRMFPPRKSTIHRRTDFTSVVSGLCLLPKTSCQTTAVARPSTSASRAYRIDLESFRTEHSRCSWVSDVP